MNKPVIGITPDRNAVSEDIEAHFFVRRNYCAAVAESGGTPLVLPYQMELAEHYLDLVDGIVLTGGMFDVDPAVYGMTAQHPGTMTLKEDRTQFERALLRGALARNMPMLGICGGMQLIAVELGAKLFQHIPSDIGTPIEHKQSEQCNVGTHRINVLKGSRLHQILGVDSCEVNSLHHQSVMGANLQLRVGAVAEDGVIEAIEASDQAFCLGVQWHPEYFVNAGERNLFVALVKAAQEASTRCFLPR